jgi:Sulfotransferase domain
MIERMIAGVKLALGLHHPGRNLAVFPDDIFIVSYPKSGNTWTRFLMANLVNPEKSPDFANINLVIPDPEALSKRRLARLPRPRIIKSHQYFDPRYRRVIYVVRDPRDVALSQYHFHIKRTLIDDSYPVERFVQRFVAGETSPYASWGENVAGWVATRYNTPGFLLLRYEDMMADTAGELAKVAALLKLDASPERLAQAVDRSSADRMRTLEKQQARKWSSTRNTRQDIPFVRTAKSGNWKSGMPQAAIETIETAWGPLMRWLGYETSSSADGRGMATFLESVLK